MKCLENKIRSVLFVNVTWLTSTVFEMYSGDDFKRHTVRYKNVKVKVKVKFTLNRPRRPREGVEL